MTGPAFFTVTQTRQIVAEPLESGAGTVTFTPTPSEAESAFGSAIQSRSPPTAVGSTDTSTATR